MFEGTFGVALDDAGERLFIAWNGRREGQPRSWESCVAMLVHIPASERPTNGNAPVPASPTQAAGSVAPNPFRFEDVGEQTKILPEALGGWAHGAAVADITGNGFPDYFLGVFAKDQGDTTNRLFLNQGDGTFVTVTVQGEDRVNRMGIGSRISVYEAGGLGDATALIGTRQIYIGYGYSSGQEAIAHIGLGDRDVVDLRVELPHGNGTIDLSGVETNRHLTVSESDAAR